MTSPSVVWSYGLGADSTAALVSAVHEGHFRGVPPDGWLVVTAIVGEEWPDTCELVEAEVLPLLASRRVRFAQVARGGPSKKDGICVLDDSRSPSRLHRRGPWTLSDDLRAGGTLPQVAGAHKCSMNFKGWPIERFLAGAVAGSYLHVMGYETSSHERDRAARDAAHDTAVRTGVYPLIDQGWDRGMCEDYLLAQFGVLWPKSACTFCPFSLTNTASRERVLDRYAADPQAGVPALVMEHLAVALNPLQGLAGKKKTLAGLLAADPRQEPALGLLARRLDAMPWRLYEVRRAIAGPGQAARSLRVLSSGSRGEAAAALRREAAARPGCELSAHDGIERGWLRHRADSGPSTEWFLVAAPEGAVPKERKNFGLLWDKAQSATASALW